MTLSSLFMYLYQFTFPWTVFSIPSPAFFGRLFDDDCSDWCEVISHCSFNLHFSTNEQYWESFLVFVSHLYVFFGEMCFSLFPTFWLGCLFFWYWVVWADCIFWKLTFVSCFIGYYFLPFWGLSFHRAYSFICCAKAFKFNQVPLVYFSKIFH